MTNVRRDFGDKKPRLWLIDSVFNNDESCVNHPFFDSPQQKKHHAQNEAIANIISNSD
jgi:hypothetical protein